VVLSCPLVIILHSKKATGLQRTVGALLKNRAAAAQQSGSRYRSRQGAKKRRLQGGPGICQYSDSRRSEDRGNPKRRGATNSREQYEKTKAAKNCGLRTDAPCCQELSTEKWVLQFLKMQKKPYVQQSASAGTAKCGPKATGAFGAKEGLRYCLRPNPRSWRRRNSWRKR